MKKPPVTKIRQKTGFTLLELSIVITIVGILLYSTISVGMSQIEVTKVKATQDKLDKINNAIALYLRVNNALPCPASGVAAVTSLGDAGTLTNTTTATATITAITKANPAVVTATAHGFANGDRISISGVVGMTEVNNQAFTVANKTANTFELGVNSTGYTTYTSGGTASRGFSNATCPNYNLPAGAPNYYVGIIPSRALGLSDDYALDSWGNRITYAVSKHCIDPTNWSSTNTYKCTDDTGSASANGGNITINDLSGAGAGAARLTNAAYVVISMGRNGLGAYNKAGTIKAAASTNAKEANNSSATYAAATFNDGLFNDGTVAANFFDDIVRWKTAIQVDYDANH